MRDLRIGVLGRIAAEREAGRDFDPDALQAAVRQWWRERLQDELRT